MSNSKTTNIFNYEFDWYIPKKKNAGDKSKEVCCEKYKKKNEKRCENCPN